MSSCCFIGHREILNNENVNKSIEHHIKLLITNGVNTFIFGSKSQFNSICYSIVSALQQNNSKLQTLCYTCKGEVCMTNSQRLLYNNLKSFLGDNYKTLAFYDKEIHFKNKLTAGKASYIERNQAMIDESDYCIFYYRENYLPKIRKTSKHGLITYQPKSGTKIALDYAKCKHKNIIIV